MFNNSDEDVFMLWQNEPTVVIGKNQNAYAEINTEYVESNNIHVARRITGGGAVYHDLGNVNYTFISSNTKEGSIDFVHFTEPIIEALGEMGICARLSGRNDILIGNRKISGNAQYSNNGRVLHHGTLLFDTDITMLSGALKVDREKIETKAIKSVSSRVTNIKAHLREDITIDRFIEILAAFVCEKYSTKPSSPPSLEDIRDLYDRQCSKEWIFPSRELLTNFTITYKNRFPFGSLEIKLLLIRDEIHDAKINGDFFSICEIGELEKQLCGTKHKDLKNKLKELDVEKYIYGMRNSDLDELIK